MFFYVSISVLPSLLPSPVDGRGGMGLFNIVGMSGWGVESGGVV